MSRLLIITRHALVPGFHLAGAEAFGVSDAGQAAVLINDWLKQDESGLLAIDHDILDALPADLLHHLNKVIDLLVVPIPGGLTLNQPAFRQQHIAEMIHSAIGIHITFKAQNND